MENALHSPIPALKDFREGPKNKHRNSFGGTFCACLFFSQPGSVSLYVINSQATQLPNLTLRNFAIIALMHDQLDFLRSKGYSGSKFGSRARAKEEKPSGVTEFKKWPPSRILMISVERFKNDVSTFYQTLFPFPCWSWTKHLYF